MTSSSTQDGRPIDHRLLSATYDVAPFCEKGATSFRRLLAMAGTGAGWVGIQKETAATTARSSASRPTEIETVDGESLRLVTDDSSKASTGSLRSADFYDGSVVDLRQDQAGWGVPGFDDSDWDPAKAVPYDRTVIQPRVATPVRRVESCIPRPPKRPDGSIALDGGQNIAGLVRLTMRGRPGDEVEVRHAEILGLGRVASHSPAAVGESDRHLHPGRRRGRSARAGLHLPRLPVCRGRERSGASCRGVRRDEQRPDA